MTLKEYMTTIREIEKEISDKKKLIVEYKKMAIQEHALFKVGQKLEAVKYPQQYVIDQIKIGMLDTFKDNVWFWDIVYICTKLRKNGDRYRWKTSAYADNRIYQHSIKIGSYKPI